MWLERRAELGGATVELDASRTTAKTLAMQLKSSRCAEEEERSACAALRNRVEASQASKREVLASISEDMRAVSRDTELLRFRLATTHTELAESRTLLDETQAADRSLEKRHRAESAALVDAHAKRCKLRTEAESARAEAVAQTTSFADLEESMSRLTSELEDLMTCSCQSGSKLDQAKRVSSSLQVESGRETKRSVLEQGRCALLARPTPDHKSDPFKKEREMINNLINRLKEKASSEAEHKGWCDTELATNTQTREEKTATVEKLHAAVDELEASMENLAMEVAELSAQVSRLQEDVSNATSIRHEETATNEEAIKGVQDAQSSLTQAIQILTDFYAKGSGRFPHTTESVFRGALHVDPGLQRKSGGRYQCHQLPPGDAEQLREARVGDHSGRVRSGARF